MLYINDKKVTPTIFPDKTSQVWNLDPLLFKERHWAVTWQFEGEGEIMHLAQIRALAENSRITCSLVLPYLPYGRQDKDVGNEATFALHSFSDMVNALVFREVIIMDPHSQVAVDRIMRSLADYPISKVSAVFEECGASMVCYPDEGAAKKYTKIYPFRSIVYGQKKRDFMDGAILSYEIMGNSARQSVLIVDDICDGGATFIRLAGLLKAQDVKEIHLFVTHGIFSKGLQVLRDAGIQRIFTKEGEQS